eukprot:6173259-Pleurochrysis_carterae.AAC.2
MLLKQDKFPTFCGYCLLRMPLCFCCRAATHAHLGIIPCACFFQVDAIYACFDADDSASMDYREFSEQVRTGSWLQQPSIQDVVWQGVVGGDAGDVSEDSEATSDSESRSAYNTVPTASNELPSRRASIAAAVTEPQAHLTRRGSSMSHATSHTHLSRRGSIDKHAPPHAHDPRRPPSSAFSPTHIQLPRRGSALAHPHS